MLVMNSISGPADKLDPIALGQSIRSAYLIADHLYVTGYGHMAVNYATYLQKPSEATKKAIILEQAARNPDPRYLPEVERMFQTIKNGRDIKHAPKQIIVATARCKKILEQLYEAGVASMKQMYLTCGFTGLEELKEKGVFETIGCLEGFDDYKGPIPYTEVLTTKWSKADEAYIIIHPFWDYAEEKNLKLAQKPDDRADYFLFRLPSFPMLVFNTPAEMKAIRQELFGQAPALRKAIADWSLQLKEQEFSSQQAAHYYAYYHRHIQPYLDEVEQRLKSTPHLSNIGGVLEGTGSENYLAITSAKSIWEYMAWSGMIPKNVLHDFEQNFAESANAGKAVLLFMSKTFATDVIKEEASDRKTLKL